MNDVKENIKTTPTEKEEKENDLNDTVVGGFKLEVQFCD